MTGAVKIERIEVAEPPQFQFLFRADDGVVVPYGFRGGYRSLEEASEPFVGAVGQVHTPDGGHAVASFACSDPLVYARAEQHLHAWARADGYELEIDPRPQLLHEQRDWRVRVVPRTPRCTHCENP